jgi:arginyl-tRNA synthetase
VTPQELSDAIVGALTRLESRGGLALPDGVPTTVTVERPKTRALGDYATNVALQLAKPAGLPPRELADRLAAELSGSTGIAGLSVAGPGFLTIAVDSAAPGSVAAAIVAAGPAYGHGERLAGLAVNLEFVSAHPTGPLHLGHTRWAVLGDALARVLAASGASVTTEFYVNDRGAQMDKFGASLEAAALGRPVPEDGYHGAYVAELAAEIVEADPGIVELPEGERLVAFREAGYDRQLAEQQAQLAELGTHFDVWFSERTLFDEHKVEHGLEVLRELTLDTTKRYQGTGRPPGRPRP